MGLPVGLSVALMIAAMIPLVLALGLFAHRKNWRETRRLAVFVLAEILFVLWFLHDKGRW